MITLSIVKVDIIKKISKGFTQHHFASGFFNKFKSGAGFTLIELLIVIAVLGVLAAVILVAIDPVEQLARGRDAGRKSSITQLGRAVQAYFTNNSAYPTVAQWTTAPNILETSGDVKVFPINPAYSTGGVVSCTTSAFPASPANGYCYDLNAASTDMTVFARMESKTENSKCSIPTPLTPFAWYSWLSSTGGPTITCLAAGTAGPVLP